MNSSPVKKRGSDSVSYSSHLYKVLLPLIKHLKEEHDLTKEDLLRLVK